MRDQVAGLTERGVPATFIDSSLPYHESEQRWTDAEFGRYRLLYLSPERTESETFLARAPRLPTSLLAVDEAHCISEWGHDFRTDYGTLGVLRDELGVPIMALTATATPRVMDEIAAALSLDDPLVVRGRFERPNLALTVEHHTGDKARTARVAELLDELELGRDPRAGRVVVYGATRKRVKAVADALKKKGFAAGFYHAGRTDGARARAQQGFEDGRLAVLVATTAFGMGIDHPDVRLVAHVQAPGSLEAYYQQAGRAGRDGHPAHCVLLYSAGDALTQARLRGNTPAPGAEAGWKALQDYVFGVGCRQGALVDWFTGERGDDCGRCDACTRPEAVRAQVDASREQLKERRDARAEERRREAGIELDAAQRDLVVAFVGALRKPVGRQLVALGLKGSQAKRVKRKGLASNPHHGALRGLPERVIFRAIDDLLDEGRLAPRGRKYPTLWLPDKAVRSASASTRSRRPAPVGLERDLKNWRKRESRRRRIKPYQVMQDAVIQEIVAHRPDNVKDLMALKGIGPTRVARYSQAILELVSRAED
jgi:ATP-dependent DNA helicase RecQ